MRDIVPRRKVQFKVALKCNGIVSRGGQNRYEFDILCGNAYNANRKSFTIRRAKKTRKQ